MSARIAKKKKGVAAAKPVHAPGSAAALPIAAWCLAAALAVTVLWARVHLLPTPFERDEGEYAYMGQLMLDGIPPYTHAYNMKPPGVYAMYAAFLAVFGRTPEGVHLGLLLINAGSAVLLFFILRALLAGWASAIGAATFLLTSVSPSVLGFAGHATQFLVFFALAGTLVLMQAIQSRRAALFFAAGVCFGLSVLMKTHAAFFCIFAGMACVLQWRNERPRKAGPLVGRMAWLAVGMALPILGTLLILALCGAFDKFWFWTVQYAARYATSSDASQAWLDFRFMMPRVIYGFTPVWILSGVGLALMCTARDLRSRRVFLILFIAASVATVIPGFYFRHHYFITMLPALSLAVAAAVDVGVRGLSLRPGLSKLAGVPLLIWAAAMGAAVFTHRENLFRRSPEEVIRDVYGSSPFVESIPVAAFVRKTTRDTDTVAVLGSEPQIYFYANRRAATGYIYMYPLMENHEYARTMQEEMIREIERAEPTVLVFVGVPTSWLRKPNSRMDIFTWFGEYRRRYYQRVGVVDIIPRKDAIYKWNGEAQQYTPVSSSYVEVLRRINPSVQDP